MRKRERKEKTSVPQEERVNRVVSSFIQKNELQGLTYKVREYSNGVCTVEWM